MDASEGTVMEPQVSSAVIDEMRSAGIVAARGLSRLDDGTIRKMVAIVRDSDGDDPAARNDLAEAEIALDRARAGSRGAGTSSPVELEREVQVLSSSVARTRADIEAIRTTVADIRQKLDSVTREVQVKTQTQQQLHKQMDHVNAVAAAYCEWNGEGLPTAGDLRVLSQPVLPELRVWPKRTLVAGIAALTAFVICLAGVLANLYLKELAESQTRS